jgi:predicted 2-oxoglutarate/Fe(II)-dependent dioxygenase YbiX/peroxiredoxin
MTDPTPTADGPALPPFKVPREALAPGDRCPNFVLPDAKGEFRAFYERVHGRPTALLFVPATDPATLDAFAAAAGRFEAAGQDLIAVMGGDVVAAQQAVARCDARFPILADPKGSVTRGYAGSARLNPQYAACYLMDANQRLLARHSVDLLVGDTLADWSLRLLAQMAPSERAERRGQGAPILMLPLVLDPHMCRALIERWERQHEEGLVTSVIDGREVTRVHDALKRRRDHAIQDPAVLKGLAATIGRRLAPELVKAFHFESFRFDRFNVTCYDSERGDYFRAHRDNESASTSDRRFAVTLNLNDEYEGGELVFPEYGPHRYAPPAGGAVVFSCSLLHEALPVTKGRRFTLLTFLSAPAPQAAATAPAGARAAPSQPARAAQPAAPVAGAGGFNPGGSAPGALTPGGSAAGGFNPGAPAPGAKPAAKTEVPFASGTGKDGLTRAGD